MLVISKIPILLAYFRTLILILSFEKYIFVTPILYRPFSKQNVCNEFWAVTSVSVRNTVFCNIMPCSIIQTDFSEESSASFCHPHARCEHAATAFLRSIRVFLPAARHWLPQHSVSPLCECQYLTLQLLKISPKRMCSLCLKIAYHKGSIRKHTTYIIQTCATGKSSFLCFVENMSELGYYM